MNPATSHFRIQRIAPGESAGAWTLELATFDTRTAKVLKKEGGSAVYQARLMGHDVVIKVRGCKGLKERLKLWTGNTRGLRHWNGAQWLKAHGLATAKPYVLATQHERGTMQEWLVLEQLPGKTLLQHIADRDLSVRQEHDIARKLARQVQAMAKAGRFNRDHKPSNLILAPSVYEPAIIDCVAIRTGAHHHWRMLHALAVEPLGLGILPRRALRARIITELCRAEFERYPSHSSANSPGRLRLARKTIWQILSVSLRNHGDPTPRTNPLSPPSR
jgi:tRNA A-37 threonylcarbamoyl transferase component Bud32